MINFKKLLKFFEKKAIKIPKRLRLIVAVFLMSFLLLFSTFFDFNKALIFIVLFFLISFIASYFALLEEIERMDWFGLFFVPVSLTILFYLFYFLFPSRWLTRLPFIIIYAISYYALLLCSNIFNVGVEKSLQLYRPAFAINFFYLTFLTFIFFEILFSFRQIFLINGLIGGIWGGLASLHLYWTIKLKRHLEKEVIDFAFFTAIILAEITFLLGFLPLPTNIAALFLATSFYSLGGIIYNFIDKRLFKETIREYIIVWFFVLFISLLSLSW